MRKLLMLTVVLFTAVKMMAQDDPVSVLNKINVQMEAVSKRYVVYQSVVAHSDNLRKAEKRRQEMMNQVTTARQSLAEIPYYKGDRMLHQAFGEYLKLVEYNLNEDYAKMVNMKEIAEQSYDKMEAYMLLKDKVSEKMRLAGEKLDSVQRTYCKKYDIKLVEEQKSELSRQLEKISEVSKYEDKLYLIFFKCNVIEGDLLESLDKKNVNATEQLRSSLKSFAEEGSAILDTLKGYRGDNTLVTACRRSMEYYKKAADKYADFTGFFTKEANFNRLKQQFEGDKDMRKDKAALDKYNNAVKEMNDGIGQYNNTNDYLNKYRSETIDFWNNAVKQFLDRHIPVAD